MANKNVEDTVIEVFSYVSGIRTGIEIDTVVYSKNAYSMFHLLNRELGVRTDICNRLVTIQDYVQHFGALYKAKVTALKKLEKELQKYVLEITKHKYAPNEKLLSEILPCSEDPVQRVRQEINYDLALGNIKSKIRKNYAYNRQSKEFNRAKTIGEIAEAML